MKITTSRKTACAGLLLLAAAVSASGQTAASCAGITPGMNVFTGGSFNGFVPWSPTSGWNQDVSGVPVDSRSPTWINSLRNTVDRRFRTVYPISRSEFWQGPWEGMPYHVVGSNQPRVEVRYVLYGDSSDPGPFPIPAYPRVQGTYGPGDSFDYNAEGDKHLFVIDKDACLLYELWGVTYTQGKVLAGTGSVYDLLGGDHQRPYMFTGGASVSGMPMFASLIRYEEIQAGEIKHALAFTAVEYNQSLSFTGMASHHQYRGGGYDPNTPPFGVRVRLRAGFDISSYSTENQIILKALKKYGMVMMDGGAPVDIYGATDKRWDDASTWEFYTRLFLTNNGDFEVIQTGPVYCDPQYSCGLAPPTGPPPVINSFTPSSAATYPGGAVTLNWNVTGAGSRIRFVTPGVGPVVTNSVVVTPQVTTTYTLMVENQYGQSSKTVTVVVTPSGNPLTPLYVGVKLVSGGASMRVTLTNPDGTTVTSNCTSSPCPVGVDTSVNGYSIQVQHLSSVGKVLAVSDVIPVSIK